MKVSITYGTRGHPNEPYECWRASGHDEDRSGWVGDGDTPTEALQQFLIHLWESGERRPELVNMLDAEFAGQEWWREVKEMEMAP